MNNLGEIEKECSELSGRLEESFNQLSRNQTCVHSLYPERLWCNEENLIPMIGYCSSCSSYSSRMEDFEV